MNTRQRHETPAVDETTWAANSPRRRRAVATEPALAHAGTNPVPTTTALPCQWQRSMRSSLLLVALCATTALATTSEWCVSLLLPFIHVHLVLFEIRFRSRIDSNQLSFFPALLSPTASLLCCLCWLSLMVLTGRARRSRSRRSRPAPRGRGTIARPRMCPTCQFCRPPRSARSSSMSSRRRHVQLQCGQPCMWSEMRPIRATDIWQNN
jgi:hypothetical protein